MPSKKPDAERPQGGSTQPPTSRRDANRPQEPPQPVVPLADVAHVVRNALVPARHHLEKLLSTGPRAAAAQRAMRGLQRGSRGVRRRAEDAAQGVA